MFCDDVIFLLFFVCSADLDMFVAGRQSLEFFFVYAQKFHAGGFCK